MSVTLSHSLVVTGPRQADTAESICCKTWHIHILADTIPSPPQSVLGALIAVNLKNSLKQLADPFYLWKKSKLDCVSAWGWVGRHPPALPWQLSPRLCEAEAGRAG